jgi:CRISPR type IV-associated protein Csf3
MKGLQMNDEAILDKLRGFHPDPSSFQPFKAVFHMQSPISLAHPWINGDALLAAQLMRKILGNDFYTLPTKRPLKVDTALQLPLKKSYGVYHASVSIFDTDKTFLTTIYKRFNSEDVDKFVKTRKGKIPKGAGFFKDCMVRTPYAPANKVTFYFNGDVALCRELLEAVPNLGKDRSRGYGVVNSVEVTAGGPDKSLFESGVFMRPIPAMNIKHIGIPEKSMLLAYKIPYWLRSNAVMCAVPGCKFAMC